MIDDFDAAILRELMRDARASTVRIAEKAHLSHSSVARRLQRLIQGGIVETAGRQANWRKLGYGVQAEVMISRDRVVDRDTAWAEIRGFRNILSLKVVTGAYDFMATAIARDLEDYGRLIDELLGLKSVDNVESLMVLRHEDGDRLNDLVDDARGFSKKT
ncbi:MAG: Lrp/AsnC family transcriptional regulator [Pseudomonadota bacterium]